MVSGSNARAGAEQQDSSPDPTGGYPALWDWRRRVASIYAEIRAEPDPVAAWRSWRDARDRLFLFHTQSPLEAESKARFRSLPFYDYDPALRFSVEIAPADAPTLSLDAGHDGALSMRPSHEQMA